MNDNENEEELEDYLINNGTQEELDDILKKASNEFFGEDFPSKGEVLVFVEIGKNSNIKYEYNHKLKGLMCDRILSTPVKYFFNYGFVPDTLSDDKDCIDAIVLIDTELLSGSYIKCKIIGCLETNDNEGDDPKLIVVPIRTVDIAYEDVDDITDISNLVKDKLVHFFTHYKDLEKGKFVNVKSFVDREKAIEIYEKLKL
jgi:inorganic pyrophosphatase